MEAAAKMCFVLMRASSWSLVSDRHVTHNAPKIIPAPEGRLVSETKWPSFEWFSFHFYVNVNQMVIKFLLRSDSFD